MHQQSQNGTIVRPRNTWIDRRSNPIPHNPGQDIQNIRRFAEAIRSIFSHHGPIHPEEKKSVITYHSPRTDDNSETDNGQTQQVTQAQQTSSTVNIKEEEGNKPSISVQDQKSSSSTASTDSPPQVADSIPASESRAEKDKYPVSFSDHELLNKPVQNSITRNQVKFITLLIVVGLLIGVGYKTGLLGKLLKRVTLLFNAETKLATHSSEHLRRMKLQALETDEKELKSNFSALVQLNGSNLTYQQIRRNIENQLKWITFIFDNKNWINVEIDSTFIGSSKMYLLINSFTIYISTMIAMRHLSERNFKIFEISRNIGIEMVVALMSVFSLYTIKKTQYVTQYLAEIEKNNKLVKKQFDDYKPQHEDYELEFKILKKTHKIFSQQLNQSEILSIQYDRSNNDYRKLLYELYPVKRQLTEVLDSKSQIRETFDQFLRQILHSKKIPIKDFENLLTVSKQPQEVARVGSEKNIKLSEIHTSLSLIFHKIPHEEEKLATNITVTNQTAGLDKR